MEREKQTPYFRSSQAHGVNASWRLSIYVLQHSRKEPNMSVRENKYQSELIKKISTLFPQSMVLKNDPNYIQGVPDLLVLCDERWAMLEVKASAKASHRPNQEYYVEKLEHIGFARFVYPENEDEVLRDLNQYFGQA
jgi:hypothetical protein